MGRLIIVHYGCNEIECHPYNVMLGLSNNMTWYTRMPEWQFSCGRSWSTMGNFWQEMREDAAGCLRFVREQQFENGETWWNANWPILMQLLCRQLPNPQYGSSGGGAMTIQIHIVYTYMEWTIIQMYYTACSWYIISCEILTHLPEASECNVRMLMCQPDAQPCATLISQNRLNFEFYRKSNPFFAEILA